MKTGIILVSHSTKIVEGTKDLIDEMISNSENVTLVAAGGTEDGRLGTSATIVLDAIEECKECENILIFYDIGSSKMSSELAIEMSGELEDKIRIMEAPIVEGSFIAAITAANSDDIDFVISECHIGKGEQ